MEEKYINQAINEFKKRKIENELEAERLLSKAIEVKPSSLKAHKLRYVVRRQLKDQIGALSDLKKTNRIEKVLEYLKKGKCDFILKHYIKERKNFNL